MSRQLVLIHGRAQEKKDSVALKAEWIEALNEGLAKNALTLPIPETAIKFPFYGDTLYDLVGGKKPDQAAQIVVRGQSPRADSADSLDPDEKAFIQAIIEQVRQKAGITDQQMIEISGQEVFRRGVLNWEWLQTILEAIDRYVPYASGASIALATYDVYQYLKNTAIRQIIDTGVSAAITPGVESVVVSHSLGTVVAYNLLRQKGQALGWKVPLFVTVGSPLGVTEIRNTVKSLSPPAQCPTCATAWFNAMDGRDVVALYPLTPAQFPLSPVTPAIVNKTDVRNKTENRHGIAGYLDDKEVARKIYDALVA
jgi:hypothetical protein